MKKINILIPGAGGFAAINAIKSLKNLRKHLKVVTTDSNPLSAGFYMADAYYILPKISDKNFINEALNIIEKENINLILPTSGFDIIPYSKIKEKLSKMGVTCFCSDYETIELCNDKYEFYKNINGKFPIPYFTLNVDEINKYPVFLKPREGKGSRNTFICRNKEEVLEVISKYKDMVICEYLPGKEYTIDVLSDLNGKAICAVPRERIETKAGISFKGHVINDLKIEEISIKLANFLNLKGPSCIQMKEDINGKLKFIEVNPRMGGGTIMATLAGVNIPNLIIKLFLNNKIDKNELNFKNIIVLRYYEEIVIGD